MKVDLVLEGGGCKLPSLVGAFAAIEQRGFEPACVCGTSAGAIVASMIAAGYSSNEMHTIVNDIDFRQFRDGAPWGTKILNLVRKKGIYSGDAYYRMIQNLMKDKGVLTFGDLKISDEEPKRRYALRIFAADITRGVLVTWPDDAKLYGLDPDFLEIAWAVRTSGSIPYFFWPIKMGGSYFVDGGLLSNFPIWQFDSSRAPRWPTFGINLWESNAGTPRKIKNNIDFLQAIIQTSLEAHDKRFIRPGDFQYRTIRVPVGDTKATDFDITAAQKETLYHNGFQAAQQFLNHWQWTDYLEWAKQVRGII